ncbi:CofH family radical SAM protein [Fibrobacter sp. UWP2]|uniref:CofH family radical SAM protein n=1 Tax=Fibrobacter sp. UWP2 TaxID=1896216 RepID=UPI0009178453|nr:CofH family radical SAM protein [Fibrobacter sp. UWP2]SHI72445.1 de-hypoxanthine futalosine cyclase [Fibrobacter sp. UWP2]
MDSLLQKVVDGEARLTSAKALDLLKKAPWTEVAEAAHAMRQKRLPGGRVGYTAFRIVNYTNVCEVTCSFCSFCRPAKSADAYVLSLDEIRQKTIEAKAKGADQIFLQGGVNREIPLGYYTDVLKMLTQEMGVKVRGFSPVELVRIAEFNQMPLEQLLDLFKGAGLSSVPGAGAEILSDRMREFLSPQKLSAKEWCAAMAACHKKGLPGSANIVFGSIETPEEIVEHLEYVRSTQDIAGGFKSFVVWTFQPQTNKFPIRHVRGDEYLKLLALSRLYLDNVPHIEVSLLGMGLSLGELGLHAGADDINSIVIEENVLKNHGVTTIEEAESFIKNAGFTPYRRSLNFD